MDICSYVGIVRNFKQVRPAYVSGKGYTPGGGFATFDIFQPNSLREYKSFELSYQHEPCNIADGKYIEFTADDLVVIQLTRISSSAPDNSGAKFLEVATDTPEASAQVRALLDNLPLTFQVEEFNHIGKIFAISIKDGIVVDGGLESYSIQRFKESLMVIKNASFIYRQGSPIEIYTHTHNVNRKIKKDLLSVPSKKSAQKPKTTSPDTWDFL